MASSDKGSGFERELCRELSWWWTHDRLDDVFWRSQASGARATQRTKKGRTTKGQYGDIAATDPIGIPLINIITIEAKRGYSDFSFNELLDKKGHTGPGDWEKLIAQAIRSSIEASTPAWMLVTRRDSRCEFFWIPKHFFLNLRSVGAFKIEPKPRVDTCVHVRNTGEGAAGNWHKVWGCPMRVFFNGVRPEHVLEAGKLYGP